MGTFLERVSAMAMKPFRLALIIPAILLGLATAPAPAQSEADANGPTGIKLLWKAQVNCVLYTAATLADVNSDGLDEIIAAGMNSIMALDGKGKTIWQWPTQERFNTYPSIWLRQNEPALIYAADDLHNMTCLDGNGKLVWQARLKGAVNWTAAVLADLTGDGRPEVIQPDATGAVVALDALTGKPVWEASVSGEVACSPSVADINGDGKPEIVVVTEKGFVNALSSDGKILWSVQMGRSLYSAPVVFMTGEGEIRIAAGSSDGKCFCMDGGGKLLWSVPLDSPTDSSISVGDIDQDGCADIFAVTTRGVIYRLDEKGRTVWSLDMQMRTDAPGAIADIDGYGSLEYILCTHRAQLLALREDGTIRHEQSLGIPDAYNATPTFGEIDRDSPGLEAVVCGGDSGWIFCFAANAQPGPTLQWSGVRRDCRMVGATGAGAGEAGASMVPLNLSWDRLLQTEGARFLASAGPDSKRPLRAEATVVSPQATRGAKVVRIHGPEGMVTLPVDVAAPGVYSFEWKLQDADGKFLVQGRRQITLSPFANESALINSTLLSLDATARGIVERLPLSAKALDEEAAYLAGASHAIIPRQDRAVRGDAPDKEIIMADSAALVARTRRAGRIAELIAQAKDAPPETSVIPFEAALWNNRNVDAALPDRFQTGLSVARRAAPGEHEPLAVNLLNITNRPLRLRISSAAPEGISVKLHRAEAVPTTMGEQSWDALPELDEASMMEIPPLETRQLWIDAAIAPDAKAGKLKIETTAQILNGAGVLDGPKSGRAVPPGEVKIVLDLDVLDFEMAPATSCRLCTWSYVESSAFKNAPAATYKDLLAHGNNVFVATLGKAAYDKEGRIVGEIDYEKLDVILDNLQGSGAYILLSGVPPLQPEKGAEAPGGETHLKALKAYCGDLVAHMKAKGFGPGDYAMYPYDEPGGRDGWKGINAMVDFGKMMEKAYPDLPIYTNAYGPTGPVMIEALAPYIDVWSPPVNLVSLEPEKMAVMRATGKPIWSYNCSYNNYGKPFPDEGTLKIGDTISEYRVAGIWAFRHGLTGIGYWTYCCSPDDPWARTSTEYMMVYTGKNGPVTSRRWEGVREGIEDFRILTALRQASDKPGLPDAARQKVRVLIEESLPRFADGMTDDNSLKAFRAGMLDAAQYVAKQ